MITEDGYFKIKDGDVCKLLFTLGYNHHGFQEVNGKMYILFPDSQEEILQVRAKYLANEPIMVNFRDALAGDALWDSNLHAYMDEKRYGKNPVQASSK